MRFERTWAILAVTSVIQLGCASAEKYLALRPPAGSEFSDASAAKASENSSPWAMSTVASVATAPASNIAVAAVPGVSLASSTTAQPSPIVITAVEPPWVGGDSSIEHRSESMGPVAVGRGNEFEGQQQTQGPAGSDQPAVSPIGFFPPLRPNVPAEPVVSAASSEPFVLAAMTSNAPATGLSVTEVPINLETALELAAGQNPQVAYANEKIRESFAKLQSAQVLWLPSLRAGANYHKHEGRIQDVAGTVIETSRNSLYNGFGSQTVGAGSPAVPGVLMDFHLKDSFFQPRIAEQIVAANRHASRAVSNDTLLETAIAYIDLLEASQIRAIVDETLANTEQLASLTAQYAKVGEGLQSDADRAATELAIRKFEVQKTIEQSRVQSVRLARLLSQDPTMYLSPAEPVLAPIELVDMQSGMSDLVAQGLSTRPELTEHQYLVGEAVERLRREQVAPLVPSVLLGLSYGGNGGGLGSSFQNYGDRMDFDAAAFWEVRNLGYGEHSARSEAQSRIRQARYRQVQVLDRVASEIVEAKTQLDSKQAQLDLAQAAITTARESHRRNSERITAGQGLPIEVQQSIQALDQAQRLYAATVADFNRAQFRLHRALGFPVMAPAKQ